MKRSLLNPFVQFSSRCFSRKAENVQYHWDVKRFIPVDHAFSERCDQAVTMKPGVPTNDKLNHDSQSNSASFDGKMSASQGNVPTHLNSRADSDTISIACNYVLPSGFFSVYSNSRLKLCADGGTNRLTDHLMAIDSPQKRISFASGHFGSEIDSNKIIRLYNTFKAKPDAICGDLDSIHPLVKEAMVAMGVTMYHSNNKDNTDLDKCIEWLEKKENIKEHTMVVIGGGLGGNLSQVLANIASASLFLHLRLIMWNDFNLAFILRKGVHTIKAKPGMYVGLFPISSSAINENSITSSSKIKTDGLKWEIDEILHFNKLISSSNVIDNVNGEITVNVLSGLVLFILDLKRDVI